jgi:RNA polymerase sigma-70 factor (ECF subfamily)
MPEASDVSDASDASDASAARDARDAAGAGGEAGAGEAGAERATSLEELTDALVGQHRELLAFVERRVGDRAAAEEILQSALVRSLEKVDAVRDSAIGWFYGVLRNAIVDHHRRAAAAARRLERYGQEAALDEELRGAADQELRGAVCRCVSRLADTLKPEYATALRRIELEGASVKDYAEEVGISSNNAGVRIFRAREALRRQVKRACGSCADHGCLDCTCGGPAPREDSPTKGGARGPGGRVDGAGG